MTLPPRAVLLATTMLSFCSLYLPQPILPALARAFDVTPATAAVLVGATMAPLAVAPIIYGYVLQTLSARRLLITTLSIMAASQVAFALAPGFGVALASRIVLGLALPAAFTSLMTVTAATAPPEHVRQAMGVYIATTIVGGFAGRALGGFLAAAWGWQAPFAVMAALLAVNVLLLTRLEADSGTSFARPGLSVIRAVLAAPHFRFSFLTIFCVFFVFAGVLNNLPFRLEVIDPGIRESDIALIYSGYLIGIVTALGANRVSAVLGGERRGLALGLGVFFVATALFAMTRVSWLLVNVFLFSIGMFTVHSLLSAMVNHRAGAYKGVVNGLYIAIYYAGGSLGAWLPAHVYAALGWNNLLHVMNAVVLVAFALMLRIFGTDRGGAA